MLNRLDGAGERVASDCDVLAAWLAFAWQEEGWRWEGSFNHAACS